ncbi:hypothetical protein [Sphingomonas sanxanigenens]|uniref:DUF2306 domain-containing protein n=1 Tax=Sphingomonas sanxanigenens DSM 19645 = NX02 TaxID=1123269 RepID=W0A571_9SPHN|nr:hypothetical protein [Sphingomonas sanxanigenens]AHE53094.1 hypothetical protein NX02_06820 [Sphingomonas sanxanigenens DSM 19645 = NX02]
MASLAPSRPRLSAERKFYLGMGFAMLILIFIGFGPSYYFVPVAPRPPMVPMSPLVHLHGAVFSLWVLLLMAQIGLVSADRRDIHMKLGVLGLPMALAMMVLGTITALHGVHRASGPPMIDPLSWLAMPLWSVPAFGGLLIAGLWRRRDRQAHKRFMMLAMFSMLQAAAGRMPAFAGLSGLLLVPGLFIVAQMVWDRVSLGRIHYATWIALVVFPLSTLIPIFTWRTEAWLTFARWASGLVA